MSNIVQGTADSQRTGDRLTLKNIQSRISIIGADATNVIRLIFFQWYQNTATSTPVIGSILQNPTYSWVSAINDTNQDAGLFRIIYDKTYQLSLSGNNQGLVKKLNFYGRRLPRKSLQFNPANTTGFNQVYCLAVSDSVAVTHPSVLVYSRTTYVDS